MSCNRIDRGLQRVKLRRTQCEHTFSALLSNSDIHHGGEQVADGPRADSCAAPRVSAPPMPTTDPIHLRDFGATRRGALSKERRGSCGDQVAGCAATLMTSRSAVRVLPLVSGPSSTEITTRTRKSIVLIIIGKAKPKFICTAR